MLTKLVYIFMPVCSENSHLHYEVIFQVLNTPGIYMIETIDSEKIAAAVNSSWEKIIKPNKEPLNVLVQVNTSNEDGIRHITYKNYNHWSSMFHLISKEWC